MEVQELRKERALPRDVDMQEVDENYVARPPIVDLKVPQGLIDIMPHIEEDFYKSIGCEEETKEVIQACLRSSTMDYSPPPLNENITSAAKKTDATLYGIQIALSQATRPLDNFVYRKYREDAECAKEDEGVALASAIRLILANIATNISQIRMENVYQAMNIPGKTQQLEGTTTKPLFDQEQLDKAIATIKPVKRTRLRKPFQKRQQYGVYQNPASTTATAPTQQSGQTHYTTGFPNRGRGSVRGRRRGSYWVPLQTLQWEGDSRCSGKPGTDLRATRGSRTSWGRGFIYPSKPQKESRR
ncbi:hypothetical protein AYI70_g7832 [Smittium culicis]|uniref:Uncharacterized protein n=1 Tax=Smittium culicis TaxID=133412 RepID=A0A1R1XIN9_9FUNG|nr:hypothetical protein AYI70_g7832 [Smittium culicis]